MSYTNETTYYGLPLPTGSDKSTFTDNNTAFQAVDAALHTAYEQSGAATEDIVAIKATVANLLQADIDFQNDLDIEKGKIRNLQDKEVLQDADIAAVKADAFDMITAYNEPTATSTHAYSVGDFFIYNDVIYRATDSIAIGDTIVPDTNCATTNVTTEISAVESDLTEVDTALSNVGTVYTFTTLETSNLSADTDTLICKTNNIPFGIYLVVANVNLDANSDGVATVMRSDGAGLRSQGFEQSVFKPSLILTDVVTISEVTHSIYLKVNSHSANTVLNCALSAIRIK